MAGASLGLYEESDPHSLPLHILRFVDMMR